MVVLLAAAAVRPGGVVLALAAQLPLVKHAAVGVQVALAPETEGSRQKTDRQTDGRQTLSMELFGWRGTVEGLLWLSSLCLWLTGLN